MATAQIQIKLQYVNGVLIIGIQNVCNLASLQFPSGSRMCVKAALLPYPEDTWLTNPIDNINNPEFDEEFQFGIAAQVLVQKTLQVNIWCLQDHTPGECLGCASISLADYQPRDVQFVQWYNVLSLKENLPDLNLSKKSSGRSPGSSYRPSSTTPDSTLEQVDENSHKSPRYHGSTIEHIDGNSQKSPHYHGSTIEQIDGNSQKSSRYHGSTVEQVDGNSQKSSFYEVDRFDDDFSVDELPVQKASGLFIKQGIDAPEAGPSEVPPSVREEPSSVIEEPSAGVDEPSSPRGSHNKNKTNSPRMPVLKPSTPASLTESSFIQDSDNEMPRKTNKKGTVIDSLRNTGRNATMVEIPTRISSAGVYGRNLRRSQTMSSINKSRVIDICKIYHSTTSLVFYNPDKLPQQNIRRKRKTRSRCSQRDPRIIHRERCMSAPILPVSEPRIPSSRSETKRQRELRIKLERASTDDCLSERAYGPQSYRYHRDLETRTLSVAARHPDTGLYFPGIVTGPAKHKMGGNYQQNVYFSINGPSERQLDLVHDVVNVGGALPWPKLQTGDYVLVRRLLDEQTECYIPGRVLCLRLNSAYEHRFFTIILYNGQKVAVPRRQIVKITYHRYIDIIGEFRLPDKPQSSPSRPKPKPNPVPVHEPVKPVGEKKAFLSQGSQTNMTRLTDLPKGQEVLARWPDDGWFYYGVVVGKVEGQNEYKVKDSTGHMASIHRDDILLEIENQCQSVQPLDCVIAAHPMYTHSYAPAKVLVITSTDAQIRFFDKKIAELPIAQMFQISKNKYKESVKYIQECEEGLCKQQAVVLDERNKCYKLKIVREVKEGQQFIVEGQTEGQGQSKGQGEIQKAIHVFPLDQRGKSNRVDTDWKYALGPVDSNCDVYLPAKVKLQQTENSDKNEKENTFILNFCDGCVVKKSSLDECFYLSHDYYKYGSKVCSD